MTSLGVINNEFILDTTAGYANSFLRISNTVRSLQGRYNADYSRTRYDLNTNSGPDDIVGQMILQEMGNNVVASGSKPYIGLYRKNGWPANVVDDPSPISPTPLATESKGKGFRIIAIKDDGVNVYFTLDSAPDFVAGDTINLARLPTYSDPSQAPGDQGDGVCYVNPGQYVVSQISGNDVYLTGYFYYAGANQ